MVIRELRTEPPVVDLGVLKDCTFAAGVSLMTTLGSCFMAACCCPYSSRPARLSCGRVGSSPLAARHRFAYHDARRRPAYQPLRSAQLIAIGLLVGSWTMFSLSHLNLNAGYWDIFWQQVIQAAAMAFLLIPLMAASTSGIPREKMGNATSIYNLMRNIGGSFGIITMTTFLARRGQVHQNQMIAHVTPFDHTARNLMYACVPGSCPTAPTRSAQ